MQFRGTKNESKNEDFIDVWHDPNPYINEYGQNHLPVRKQKTAEGHAVRATYLYCAMADIAQKYQDESLFEACENLYNNIINKRNVYNRRHRKFRSNGTLYYGL